MSIDPTTPSRYVTERQVAEFTGIALSTLRTDRSRRRGIPFVKKGRSVRYALHDVVTFMESRKILTEDAHDDQKQFRNRETNHVSG